MDSILYTEKTIYNLIHKIRLNRTLKLLADAVNRNHIHVANLCDFGCCDGFITQILADKYKPKNAVGYDYDLEALERGRENYGLKVTFKFINLNEPYRSTEPFKFDLITCFESLEHINRPAVAIDSILNMLSDNGLLILSVPIEIGFIGLLKLLIKSTFYKKRYRKHLSQLNSSVFTYGLGLLMRKHKEMDRENPVHFGFDHRNIDTILKRWRGGSVQNGSGTKITFLRKRKGTTMYYICHKVYL